MNLDFWKNKKVFITGNTGFKGSWLSLILLKLNCNIVGYSFNPPTKPSLFNETALNKKFTTYFADVRNFEKLYECINSTKPDIIIHCAAQSLVYCGYENPLETYSTNVMGTVNVLEALRKVDFKCILINVTSDKCYLNKEEEISFVETDPMGGKDPYSSSKGCSEIISNSYIESFFNKDSNYSYKAVASVRAGNVIGGGDWAPNRLIPDLMKSYLAKSSLTIRNPNFVRPWQHVLEPLFGYLELAEKLFYNKDFMGGWNFGPSISDQMSVIEIVNKFSSKIELNYQNVANQDKN